MIRSGDPGPFRIDQNALPEEWGFPIDVYFANPVC